MKKRLLSLFLVFVTLLGILPTAALAANTEEEALGEVDIYIRVQAGRLRYLWMGEHNLTY